MLYYPFQIWRLCYCLFILWNAGIIRLLRASRAQSLHGQSVGQIINAKTVANISKAIIRLGPVFIKLGQTLSVRPDLIGRELANALKVLQDDLPSFPGKLARKQVEEQLGKPIDGLYRKFSFEPIAAASIAQVHLAQTIDGKDVAVKILRPDIEKEFARDIALMRTVAKVFAKYNASVKRLKVVEAVEQFASWVKIELNLRLEAAAASELKDNFESNHENFHVPAIIWPLCSKRVLTMERVEGMRIDDLAAMKAAGLDPGDILGRASRVFFTQVFRDGFFHADMHPGNIFITSDGTIKPVDFGIMGRLSQKNRLFLASLLKGFLERDYEKITDIHFAYGLVGPDQSRSEFTLAVRAIGEPIMGLPMQEISLARLLSQLFEMTAQFQVSPNIEFLLLQKTMLSAEGIGRILEPDRNMWVVVQPLVEEWISANCSIQARIMHAGQFLLENSHLLSELLESLEKNIENMRK